MIHRAKFSPVVALRLLLILASLLAVHTIRTAHADPEGPRARIKAIKNYIVYYGKGKADVLAAYDLVIVQPDTLTSDELAALKQKGVLTVAYLSIGEVEPTRPWYNDGRVDFKWILGRNPNWGSYYIDAREPGWQKLMITLTAEYLPKGFDGVFLDTVDTVDVYSDTKSGMIGLIQALRQTYPDNLLVQNRGFSVLDQVASTIDAVMFEDLSTSYDFAKKAYLFTGDLGAAQDLIALHKRTGLPVLALDYAPPDNPAVAYLATQIALKDGFIPAVSVISLDEIPDYGLDKGGPANVRIQSISVESDGDQTAIVAHVQNVGLSAIENVPLSMSVDGTPIASTTHGFAIGERFDWRVTWENPAGQALINVTALQDGTSKTRDLRFNSAMLSMEPLLPLDQQKLRPESNGPTLAATFLSTPITIDGDLSEWKDLPCTEVKDISQVSFGDKAKWGGPQDLSGRVCYAWDKTALYVGFSVNDDHIVQQFTGGSLWRGDHVELWFDTQLQLDFDHTTNDDDDFQLGVSPGNFSSVKPDFVIFTPNLPPDSYLTQVNYAVVKTPTGYAGEVRLPASVLKGLRLAPDHAIGATFEPSDTDTPGGTEQERMMSTAPQSSSHWGNPTLWNTLILKAGQ